MSNEEYNLQEIISSEEQPQVRFDSLPIWKLVLFEILSFGFYDLAWFFTQWNSYRKINKENIFFTIIKTIFYPLSGFSLFPKYNEYFCTLNKPLIPPVLFPVIILFLNACIKILDKLEINDYDWTFIFPIEIILCVVSIIPLIITQRKINEINKELYPDEAVNIWTWKTIVFIIIVIPIWFLIFAGYLVFTLEIFGIITLTD